MSNKDKKDKDDKPKKDDKPTPEPKDGGGPCTDPTEPCP